MVVIRYDTWLAAGRLPRSSDGCTTPRREGDVVVGHTAAEPAAQPRWSACCSRSATHGG